MKKLLAALLLLSSFAHAKTVTIGTGSGRILKNDMLGLQYGDILQLAPGKYDGGDLGFMKGITITGLDQVVFTGQVNINTLVECSVEHFKFENCKGICFKWWNNNRRTTERFITFNNSGDANDGINQTPYNGDTSSLRMYIVTFDSLTLFKSGMLLMGTYASTLQAVDYVDSLVMSRIKIDSTATNGTEVRGVFFRLHAYDWKVMFKGINTVTGDVGLFQMCGNGSWHHIYRNGGRGYIFRVWNASLIAQGVKTSTVYNIIDVNTNVYGSYSTEVQPDQFNKYVTGGNMIITNNTTGNKGDNINYWSPMVMEGDFVAPFTLRTQNNLVFRVVHQNSSGPKQPVQSIQGKNGTVIDTANNMYFESPVGIVDSVTGVPTIFSPVIGKGIPVAWIKDDVYHNPRTGAFNIGAVQSGASATLPSPTPCPPVVICPIINTDSIIKVYLSSHPCPVCPKIDSMAIFNSMLISHPCPPPVICPVCPAPPSPRTVIKFPEWDPINKRWIFTYQNGEISVL